MAYELTKSSINSFNKFYGVNISLDKIRADAARLNSFNQALMIAFQEAYAQVVLKDLIKKDGEVFLSQDMFKDFNSRITNALIDETPKSRRVDLSLNMGIETSLIAYNMMEAMWNTAPKNQVDAVAENYMKGNIRIRDMVAFSESILALDTTKNRAILASYALALKKVNEGRSFLWRVFHPFRNHAEQRDAGKMADMLTNSRGTFTGPAFTQAGSTLVNFDALEKETIQHVLKNQNLIEHRLSDEEKEKRIRDEFQTNIIFEPGTTDEQKEQEYNKYRYRRMQEFQGEEVHKQQQDFMAWLNNFGKDLAPVHEKDHKENAHEESRVNVAVDEVKEPPVVIDANNQNIHEEPVIQNPDLIK